MDENSVSFFQDVLGSDFIFRLFVHIQYPYPQWTGQAGVGPGTTESRRSRPAFFLTMAERQSQDGFLTEMTKMFNKGTKSDTPRVSILVECLTVFLLNQRILFLLHFSCLLSPLTFSLFLTRYFIA